MKILFVHQSFPGQYRNVIRALASQGLHQLVALGLEEPSEPIPKSVSFFRYQLTRGNTPGLHDWLIDIDSKFIRGEACARAATLLRDQGFFPDLICSHPGWGEALFLRDVWPSARILCYQEFFYHSIGFDYDFDPELQGIPTWEDSARLRMKNANPLLMLDQADWNVTPTSFQKRSFPTSYHSRITVVHDGIDTQLASPDPNVGPLQLPDGTLINPGDPLVTFVNRRIEPYRGCHTFLRAVPEILDRHSKVHIVVVGSLEGVSYGKPAPQGSWKDVFMNEIEGLYDTSRLHFTGHLQYNHFIHLLKLSSCHVYLTYPFVLSWSMLEAMSIGCPVIGSSTPPVQEVITDGHDGLLVDFFSSAALASSVDTLLTDRPLALEIGRCARETILSQFSLEICVPQHLALMHLVSAGSLS